MEELSSSIQPKQTITFAMTLRLWRFVSIKPGSIYIS